MALTELKSSDIMLDKPASFVSCVSDITSHRDIDQVSDVQMPANVRLYCKS